MKKLLFLLLVFVSVTTICSAQADSAATQDGFRLDARSRSLVNAHGVVVATVSETTVDVDTVIKRIAASPMRDGRLAARVLGQYPPGEQRIGELMNMAATYNEVAVIVIANMEEKLAKKYSAKELED